MEDELFSVTVPNLFSFKIRGSIPNNLIGSSKTKIKYNSIFSPVIKICGESYKNEEINPFLFEQNDYFIELYVESDEIKLICSYKKMEELKESHGTYYNKINFQNDVGNFDLSITKSGKNIFSITFEVFSLKMDYREDYVQMKNDIRAVLEELLIDVFSKTYKEFPLGPGGKPNKKVWWNLLDTKFKSLIRILDVIEVDPNKRLYRLNEEVLIQKSKKVPKEAIHWLKNNLRNMHKCNNDKLSIKVNGKNFLPTKILNVNTIITMDTKENQFLKFVLKDIASKLKDYLNEYKSSRPMYRTDRENWVDTLNVIEQKIERMIRDCKIKLNSEFFREISDIDVIPHDSPVLKNDPNYRAVYSLYLFLQQGIRITGHVLKLDLKEISTLYEYWCYIKLVDLLRTSRNIDSLDFIKLEPRGVVVTLKKGIPSGIILSDEYNKENKIELVVYNRRYSEATGDFIPDITLTSKDKNIIFDAKYSLDFMNMSPRQESIDKMHAYRDAIRTEKFNDAIVLFPGKEMGYKDKKLYKSIFSVGVGGLPFLPDKTELVKEYLDNEIKTHLLKTFE